jgi:hypothetical protein
MLFKDYVDLLFEAMLNKTVPILYDIKKRL